MTANVFISGFVQGVGYRKYVKKIAKEIGLKGWVKNLSDGRVQVEFYGDRTKIEKVMDKLWEGSYLAKVKDIEIEWIEEEDSGSEDFIIFR